MVGFVIRRILWAIPTLLLVSIVAFVIIDLPPGDYLDVYISNLTAQGIDLTTDQIEALEARYALGKPLLQRYAQWMENILLHGDFGRSFKHQQPVSDLIWGRLQLTLILALTTLMLTWITALPIGIYSAVNQYSIGDYLFTTLGFIGLAIPNFLLALLLMYFAFKNYGYVVGGLFSPEYVEAPWSWGRVLDLLSRMWIPVIIIGTAGTAGLIRTMRANLLDELKKPYVITARAKGLPEWKVILKHPVRIALNPFVSTVGWVLPQLVSGSVIVAVVLSLPTTGPLLLNALTSQDMYLAGAFILMLSTLTVIGTLVSDLLLAWLDPRIRYE
ncbi:MAG: ABC transporter permease [Aggregatilineales bacterium]